jgi:hypothetical protein
VVPVLISTPHSSIPWIGVSRKEKEILYHICPARQISPELPTPLIFPEYRTGALVGGCSPSIPAGRNRIAVKIRITAPDITLEVSVISFTASFDMTGPVKPSGPVFISDRNPC